MAATAGRIHGDDVPGDVIDALRAICGELPDAYVEPAWVGVRWRVRTCSFPNVLTVADERNAPRVVLTFRSEGDELEALSHAGPPLFVLGWGRNPLGMVIDGHTDWEEMRELVTDSFCVMAPNQLAARVLRSPPV